jgi:hypothetical protein
MNANHFVLLLVVLLLALHLNMEWLAILVGVGAVMALVASIEIPSPQPVPMGGKKKEEILTPVVVQDVGEPPYLYPPNFDLRVAQYSQMPWWFFAARAFGKAVRGPIRAARGDPMRRGTYLDYEYWR